MPAVVLALAVLFGLPHLAHATPLGDESPYPVEGTIEYVEEEYGYEPDPEATARWLVGAPDPWAAWLHASIDDCATLSFLSDPFPGAGGVEGWKAPRLHHRWIDQPPRCPLR